MKLLLDTHIWVWLLENPERLAPNTKRELADPTNELWLSPVSAWEVVMLHRKGRMRLPKNPDDWLPLALAEYSSTPRLLMKLYWRRSDFLSKQIRQTDS